jgi:hypothetical protein
MRDDERSRAGIEECAGKTGERFCAGLIFGRRIAGGENSPIGIKLELRNLAGRYINGCVRPAF